MLEEELGELVGAAHHYAAAIAIHADVGDRRYEGIHQTQLARVRFESGDIDAARELLRRSLHIHREMDRLEALDQGRLVDDAALFWSRSAGLARDVGDPTLLALVHARLAAAEQVRGGDHRPHQIVVDVAVPRIDDPGVVAAVAVLRGGTTERTGVQVRAAQRVIRGCAEAASDAAPDGLL